MTEDARRLLAWKGLGVTPAAVFTITFPPTAAGTNKEIYKQLNGKQFCNVSHVCQRTSLDGCAHSGIFYGSWLKNMKHMSKIVHWAKCLVLDLNKRTSILVKDVLILTSTAALGTAAAPATVAAWGTWAAAWPIAGAWVWLGAAWVWGVPACCCWANCWAFCCSARACKQTHNMYNQTQIQIFR